MTQFLYLVTIRKECREIKDCQIAVSMNAYKPSTWEKGTDEGQEFTGILSYKSSSRPFQATRHHILTMPSHQKRTIYEITEHLHIKCLLQRGDCYSLSVNLQIIIPPLYFLLFETVLFAVLVFCLFVFYFFSLLFLFVL